LTQERVEANLARALPIPRKHRVTIENVHELARALGMPMDHHGQRGREIGG
jgi:hypothetical protein